MNLKKKLKESLKPPVEWKLRPEILCRPKQPEALHGVVPREILGPSWWNKTRQKAYESTNFHCIVCGVQKYKAKYHPWLEGHELYEIDYLCATSTYVETIPVCHFCHNYYHSGRLQALLAKGEIHHAKFVAIIQHGDEILAQHNLVRNVHEGPMPEWGEWRLIIDGLEYKPLYPTFEEYRRAHGVVE